MNLPSPQQLLQAGFACAIAVFAPAASCDGGDRNMLGGCPTGEVCSDETEDGLHFVGPIIAEGFFDSGAVKVMATNGTQHVELEETIAGERDVFDLPYDATADGGATVETQNANVVVLRGESGTGTLRITDPVSGTLYDRIRIDAMPVARVELLQTFAESLEEPEVDDTLYAPGADVYVGLRAADGTRLVDDSMQLTGPGTQRAWDRFRLAGVAPGVYALGVVAAGESRTATVRVVAGPDRIKASMAFGYVGYKVGQRDFRCFASFLGDRYVHAPWAFSADNADLAPSAIEGCVHVTARSPGAVVIHARGGGVTLDHTETAVEAERRAPTGTYDVGEPVGTAGDRATIATIQARAPLATAVTSK